NDVAAADYESAIALDPSSAFAFYGRGLLLAERGDRARAIDDLAHAVDDPKLRASALLNRGRLRVESGDEANGKADLLLAAEAGSAQAAGRLLDLGATTESWSGAALESLARFHGNKDDRDFDAEAEAYEAAVARFDDDAKRYDALVSLGLVLRGAEKT